jgi:protein unc-45
VANRGLLAHQGAIKLILALLGKPVDQQTKITFTHALAKILISVNPSLVFSSRTPITAPIQPLTDLLTTESLPNELPRFEGLLALTNLASADETARTIIIDKTWPVTETLLLSDTPLIQRAATELVCNLVASQKGVDKFIPSAKNSSATSRLHLLLALADVDDVSTRSAAGGALAMLTGNKEVCNALGEVERSLERVAGMVDDQDEGVAFRGTVCVAKLIENGGGKMNKRLQQAGLSEKLRMYMKRSTNPKAKVLCGEVLDCLA